MKIVCGSVASATGDVQQNGNACGAAASAAAMPVAARLTLPRRVAS
jgi:hypothetical protein